MSAEGPGHPGAPFGESDLIASLLPTLRARFGAQTEIADIRRTALDSATSFRTELVEVELKSGDRLKLFLKDLRVSRLPKDGLAMRRQRELRVYRDLLHRAETGTARCYGAVGEPASSRCGVLLEYVDGIQLWSRDFDDWIEAAAWLGRFQGEFRRHREDVERCEVLVRHDAAFFQAKARIAQDAVAAVAPALAERLAHALRNYDRVIDAMTTQPRTFVHGSYRPQNILVVPTAQPLRVCPVDWELAAWGAPLYDLAFLSDGFEPSRSDVLWEAYRSQTDRYGLTVPPKTEFRHLVDCFRLHKTVKALSECNTWNFSERKVAKLVTRAEEVTRACV